MQYFVHYKKSRNNSGGSSQQQHLKGLVKCGQCADTALSQFRFQLDESTLPSNDSLLPYVRYSINDVRQEIIYAQLMAIYIKGESISRSVKERFF